MWIFAAIAASYSWSDERVHKHTCVACICCTVYTMPGLLINREPSTLHYCSLVYYCFTSNSWIRLDEYENENSKEKGKKHGRNSSSRENSQKRNAHAELPKNESFYKSTLSYLKAPFLRKFWHSPDIKHLARALSRLFFHLFHLQTASKLMSCFSLQEKKKSVASNFYPFQLNGKLCPKKKICSEKRNPL